MESCVKVYYLPGYPASPSVVDTELIATDRGTVLVSGLVVCGWSSW